MAKECTENTLGGETKKFASNKKEHMKKLILQKQKNFQEIRQYDDNIVIFLSIMYTACWAGFQIHCEKNIIL